MDNFTRTEKQRFPKITELLSSIQSSRDLYFVQEFLRETDFLSGTINWMELQEAFRRCPTLKQQAAITRLWDEMRRLAGKIQNEASWVNARKDEGGSGVQ
jgi:hypothetical protein